MLAVLFRLGLLALGLGLAEIGLADTLVDGSAASWVVLLGGLLLVVAGTSAFIGPLLAFGRAREERYDD